MPRIDLTEPESKFLLDMLELLFDKLSAAGCNDYMIGATDENKAFIDAAYYHAQCAADDFPSAYGNGSTYCLQDFVLLDYLLSKVRTQIAIPAAQVPVSGASAAKGGE